MTNVRFMRILTGFGGLWLGLAGCGEESSGGPSLPEDEANSGFSPTSTSGFGSDEGLDADGSTTDAPDDDAVADGAPGDEGPTGGEATTMNSSTGEPFVPEDNLRGVLTFALYKGDVQSPDDVVGIAGAWRTPDNPLTEVEDFFGVWGLATANPVPPNEPDTIEHNGLLAGFDWGNPFDWQRAGNAMKLATGETEALACLLYLSDPPELTIGDQVIANYPVYVASTSAVQPDVCRPEASSWQADTTYDLVLYGGELFEDNVLAEQVTTPPEFEVTAPDMTRFQAPLDSSADLTLSWSGDANEGDRMVVRATDMFGRTFTAHATDDGAFVIPAADLQQLDAGPVTLSLAREHLDEVQFSDGSVTVLTRFERRGYFDLF